MRNEWYKPSPDVDLEYFSDWVHQILMGDLTIHSVVETHPFFNGFPGHVNPSIQVNVCPRNQMKAKDCMHL